MSDDKPSLYVSIQDAMFALATMRELPAAAIAFCRDRYSEAGPLLHVALQRGANDEITDEEEARLFFRSLFIIAECRDPLGFEPLLRLLRRPYEDVEWLLGDAITETLPHIVAGTFNGDTDALFAAILDLQIGEIIRLSLFGAATFLTWDGRIERDRMTAFLERFYQERSTPALDSAWTGWVEAIALLGLRDLAPLVHRAWDEGVAMDDLIDAVEFAEILERAERAPDDPERFKDQQLGYIEDVLQALEEFPEDEDDVFDEEDVFEEFGPPLIDEPVINPMRHVGRNDPCPCGSGKKAKRCCLAA